MALFDYESYNVANWDGYGAEPIRPETLAFAQRISRLLERKPDDAPGGDGSICWEWRDGDDILCLDVDSSHEIRMYGKVGGKFIRSAPQVVDPGQTT